MLENAKKQDVEETVMTAEFKEDSVKIKEESEKTLMYGESNEIKLPEFKQYSRKGLSEMRTFVPGEDLSKISVSPEDLKLKTLQGGYVARNPANHEDQWYVAKKYFEDNLEEVAAKSLGNTDASGASVNVKDIVFFGNGDTFKLICKASSKNEKWMKSTKAMSIPGVGCVIQITTQQGDNVSEAVTFVPGVKIHENFSHEDGEGELVISRELIAI